MIEKIIVKRYAEAFIAYVKDSIGIEKALEDLKNFKDVLRENPDLPEFLKSPEITHREKCQVIDKVLNEDFSQEIGHLLKLLLEKGRIEKIKDIIEYIRITYSHKGESEVLLKTTFPLDLAVIKNIENKLEKKFNRKFKFYIDLDASLLGGLQITIGNTVMDGSVKRRLGELQEKLETIRIS